MYPTTIFACSTLLWSCFPFVSFIIMDLFRFSVCVRVTMSWNTLIYAVLWSRKLCFGSGLNIMWAPAPATVVGTVARGFPTFVGL
jgi:hypothetical protein